MGERALADAGYYIKQNKDGQPPRYNNDWTGIWTGKYGIKSLQDFKDNPAIQGFAIREYHTKIWKYLENVQGHENQEIKGIILTKSGMISAAHLVGHSGLKKFIKSNGEIDVTDKSGVPCSEYLKEFQGYSIDFSRDTIEHLKSSIKGLSDSVSEEPPISFPFSANAIIDELLRDPAKLAAHQQESMKLAMHGLEEAEQ